MATFVRKTKILSDGYLDMGYPDLSDGGNTILPIKTGIRKTIGYSNFQIAEKPPYGDALLIGATLNYYLDTTKMFNAEDSTTTVSAGNDDGSLAMYLYNTKSDVLTEFSEGSTTVANSDILAFSSRLTTAPLLYDDFDGKVLYEEPQASVRWSEGVKMREKGASISVAEAHIAQKGAFWQSTEAHNYHYRMSQEDIFGMYAYKAEVRRVRDSNAENRSAFEDFALLLANGADNIGTPYLESSPLAATGGGYSFDVNARVPIVEAKGIGGNTTTMIPNFLEHTTAGFGKLVKGVGRVFKKDFLEDHEPDDIVKKKWVPKYGTQLLQDDIYFRDEDIKDIIEYDTTDIIEQIPQTHPLLQKPEAGAIVREGNSIWTNMRKTSEVPFRIESEGGEEDESGSAERVFIAQSNSVFTQDSNTVSSCLFENIHAYFSNEQDHHGYLKAPNSKIDMLQEVRGQVFVPAPLNLYPYGDTQQTPNPFIHIPIRLELPPPFVRSATDGGHATRMTLRRAAWFVFNRHPIGPTNDILSWWYQDNARYGAYGVVIIDGNNTYTDEFRDYYVVADIHDLVNMDDIISDTGESTPAVSDEEPILDLGPGIDALTFGAGSSYGGNNYSSDGIHRNVPLTPITGSSLVNNGRNATADITVASGNITDVQINQFGHFYDTTDYLEASGMIGAPAITERTMKIETTDNTNASTHGEIVLLTSGGALASNTADIAIVRMFKEDSGGTYRQTEQITNLKEGHHFNLVDGSSKNLALVCSADATDEGDYTQVAVVVAEATDSTVAAMYSDEESVTLKYSRRFTCKPSSITGGKDIKAFIPKDQITGDGTWADLKFHATSDGLKMTLTKPADAIKQYNNVMLQPDHSSTVAKPKVGQTIMPYGKTYISLSSPFQTHPEALMGTYAGSEVPLRHTDNREWSVFRKYHIKSAYAGTQAAGTGTTGANLNVWSENNSAKGIQEGTAGTGLTLYNGIRNATLTEGPAASLTYMWSPYFTVSLTNTRYNGDRRGTASINDNVNLEDADGVGLDSITRLYMDKFEASRFNYTHQNASMNTANVPSNNLTISSNKNDFVYLKYDEHSQDVPWQNNGTGFSSAENKSFITLGFKNKTEAHASAKYFLMNGFATDTHQSAMPSLNCELSYSSEMHPMGEFFPLFSSNSTPSKTSAGYDINFLDYHVDETEGTGFPLLRYEPLFGKKRSTNWTNSDDSVSNGAFNNTEALSETDDYLLTGNNYVEEFTQHGIFKLDWNDVTTSELGNKLYLHGAASLDNNRNSSGYFDTYKLTITTDSSTNDFSSSSRAAWGLQETDRGVTYGGTCDLSWTGPNLNTLLIWSDESGTTSSNRGDACTVHAMDNDHNFYISRTCSVTPADDNRFFMSPGRFVRRENPMVQARILHAEPVSESANSSSQFKVLVDDGSILNNSEDEIYIIYHAGREWVTQDHLGGTVGSGFSADANDMVRQNKYVTTLCKAARNEDGSFTLTNYESTTKTNPVNVACSDTNAGNLDDIIYDITINDNADNIGYSDASLIPQGRFINSTLCISPWRYWIYIAPEQDQFERAYKSVCQITSTADSDFSEAAGATDCAFKTSFNSPKWTDSHVIERPWSWGFNSSSQLDLNTDYGHGAFNFDEQTGGFIDKRLVLPGKYVEFNLSGLISSGRMTEQEKSTVILMGENNGLLSNYQATFHSDDGTNKPYLYSIFFDALPTPPADFSVRPQEEKEFYPEFTWSNQSDDVWYGLLIVDDRPINNQYHSSILHMPLNEETHNTSNTAYYRPDTGVLYGSTDTNGSLTQSGFGDTVNAVTANIEGLAGYTAHFDGSSSYIKLNDGRYTQPTTDMSICLHIMPDNTPTGNEYILHKEYEYSIFIDTNKQINVEVFPESSDESSNIPIELKSTSSVLADGISPTNIIVTLDTALKSGNVKLYIDGRLEDQSGLRKATATKNNWPSDVNLENYSSDTYIGCYATGSSRSLYYDGKVEELTIYNSVINPVTPKDESFIFKKPVRELTDATEAVSRSYTGKIFIKDYHNIRGVGDKNVVSSPQVSFRKAAFRLRTEN